jgi:hypothetical protein
MPKVGDVTTVPVALFGMNRCLGVEVPVNDRSIFIAWKVLFTICALLLLASSAHAYASPGAVLELGAYAISMMAWVGIAFSALFLYPFYALLRRLRSAIKSRATTIQLSNVDSASLRSNDNALEPKTE